MPSQPVIVGVADIKNPSRSAAPDQAIEPLLLMHQAILDALKDTNLPEESRRALQSTIDSVDVVANWTWPYPNTPDLVALRLGARPGHRHESDHGGHSPAKLLDEAARRVAGGESKVAVVTGGEALASLNACIAEGKFPPPHWTQLENPTALLSLLERDRGNELAARHGVGKPIQVYPLYEAAFRAQRQQGCVENHQESAQLYAQFAEVAAKLPQAWGSGKADSAEAIGTVTAKNRMICTPYPLLMNAFNTVNLAAACVVTSTEYARELGIPEDRWIYPLGGAGTADAAKFQERTNFYTSPSISNSLDAALGVSGLDTREIDLFDFYSCFPIVPKLACHHLGLPITEKSRPLTVLGGLTSFGGAGNNYSLHAITQMTRELRARHGRTGLVLANGGVLSYHHTVCLSTTAPGRAYPRDNPLPAVLPVPSPPIDEKVDGRAVIETYTVEFKKDGTPKDVYVVGRLKDTGHRFLANAADGPTMLQLSSMTVEQVGRAGWVHSDAKSGRNLFSTFDAPHL